MLVLKLVLWHLFLVDILHGYFKYLVLFLQKCQWFDKVYTLLELKYLLALSCDAVTKLAGLSYEYLNGSRFVGDMLKVSCASSTAVFENNENEFMWTCIEENLQPRWEGLINFTECYGKRIYF